jgi:hypothetical protein
MREQPEVGIRHDDRGTQAIGPREDGRFGVVVNEHYCGQTTEPTLGDLSQALVAVWGTDFGVHSPIWISRFTDMTRQAASYREGRVLLAGDAAHVHYPVGGQGLNVGVQDAVNLGWKLAQLVRGTSPESLLDTYQAERHPVAAAVLQNTMAQTALTCSGARMDAVRATVTELLGMDEPRRRIAAMISGLDVQYDLGEGHPLLGRRMPDLDLLTVDGTVRVFTLLHGAGGVLLNLRTASTLATSSWADRVSAIDAEYGAEWELPVDRLRRRACRRPRPARRPRGLGGRRHRRGTSRRADHVVRTMRTAGNEPCDRARGSRSGHQGKPAVLTYADIGIY